MNDLDLCLEVVQGHVNHCGVNSSKTTSATDFKFSTRLCMSNAEQSTNNFPESGRGLGHVIPTIFGIRSNSKTTLSKIKSPCRYVLVYCEAVRSAILATAWLLVRQPGTIWCCGNYTAAAGRINHLRRRHCDGKYLQMLSSYSVYLC